MDLPLPQGSARVNSIAETVRRKRGKQGGATFISHSSFPS